MWLSLSFLMAVAGDPPAGLISPLAWAIISALATACTVAIPALWYRGNKIQDQMYQDLKVCNEKNAQSEEDILGLMKVLRLQMEKADSKRGEPQ